MTLSANDNPPLDTMEFVCSDCDTQVYMMVPQKHYGRCMTCQFVKDHVPEAEQEKMRKFLSGEVD